MGESQRRSRRRRTTLDQAKLSISRSNSGNHRGAPTSDSVANLGEIEPACSWYGRVPALLDWCALHYDSNASEHRDKSSGRNANPDKPNLCLISHNSKKEYANGHLAYANGHDSRHLTEQFVLDSRDIGGWIIDIHAQLAYTVEGPDGDENGVKDMESLYHVGYRIKKVDL